MKIIGIGQQHSNNRPDCFVKEQLHTFSLLTQLSDESWIRILIIAAEGLRLKSRRYILGVQGFKMVTNVTSSLIDWNIAHM